MRNMIIPAGLAACLVTGAAAWAATPAKPTAPSEKTAVDPAAAKRMACEKTWSAQKKHTGKHKAFVAACVAKG